jgi:ribosomal protein S18 acetylase RimI-like enzyme
MEIRPFEEQYLEAVVALWNQFWEGVPRAFPIRVDDFCSRVLEAPTYAESTLLVAVNGTCRGFVHFGPQERWWFQLQDRPTPSADSGVIHALCAPADDVRAALLAAAEDQMQAAGGLIAWLWPTWAQGAMPFYNGLTPSNELSGQWRDSPLVAWAESRGYEIGSHSRVAVLEPLAGRNYPEIPTGARACIEDFQTPIVPRARVLRLIRGAELLGQVVYCGANERNHALHTRECAAFDVEITEGHRGQGWGKAMMGALVRQAITEGYTSMQLEYIAGNSPAENLYLRSIGFHVIPGGEFVAMRRSLRW